MIRKWSCHVVFSRGSKNDEFCREYLKRKLYQEHYRPLFWNNEYKCLVWRLTDKIPRKQTDIFDDYCHEDLCVHVRWSNCLLFSFMCCSPMMCRDRRVTWTRRSWLHLEFLDIREIHDIEDVFNFLRSRYSENYVWVYFTSFSKWLIRQKCLLTWSNSFYEKDHPHIQFRMGEICDDNLSSDEENGLKSTNKFLKSVWLDFLRPLSVDAEMIYELNMIESFEKSSWRYDRKRLRKVSRTSQQCLIWDHSFQIFCITDFVVKKNWIERYDERLRNYHAILLICLHCILSLSSEHITRHVWSLFRRFQISPIKIE